MYNRKNHILVLFTLLFVTVIFISSVNAFWGATTKTIAAISKTSKVLPNNQIIRLSKLSDEIKGTVKVKKELGKLNLSNAAMEDVFLRIAIHHKKITRKAAEGLFSRLSGVPGFRSTLKKIIGNSSSVTRGLLNELKIADAASLNGFKVLGIGKNFFDGIKQRATDIDIVLKKRNKIFAIEAKDYSKSTSLTMDKVRADMNSLVIYKNKKGKTVIPVFTITKEPTSSNYLKMMRHEADKRNVQLIFGTPQEQVEQIKMLGEIL